MAMSEGEFWCRRGGGHNFYCSGQSRAEIEFDFPVAACGADASEISISGIFAKGKDYWLAVKNVSVYGLESDGYAWVRVRTDASLGGSEVPDQVQNLTAGIGYYGRVKLEWDYEPRLMAVRPAVFNVYVGDEESGVRFDFVEGQVSYRENQKHYVWDGTYLVYSYPYKIVVRAVTAAGVDCGCQRYILARADDVRPGAVEGATAEMA
jgi:hypothetical protein